MNAYTISCVFSAQSVQNLMIYKAKVAKIASHIVLTLALDPRSFLWPKNVAMATGHNTVAYVIPEWRI